MERRNRFMRAVEISTPEYAARPRKPRKDRLRGRNVGRGNGVHGGGSGGVKNRKTDTKK